MTWTHTDYLALKDLNKNLERIADALEAQNRAAEPGTDFWGRPFPDGGSAPYQNGVS